MTLALLFSRLTHQSAHAAPDDLDVLEAALLKMFAAGRSSWPQIEIPAEEFVRFLAMQLPAASISSTALLELRADELYLMRALGLGNAAAILAFETDYMAEVRRTLRRIGSTESLIPDIIQTLYDRLLERQNSTHGGEVNRQGYAGRGELKGWLCTSAIRQYWRQQQRTRREAELWQSPALLLPNQVRSPDLALLTGELKELFETAFREAVTALTSKERNLLRYHFISGLSIDQIGLIYRVHRATAARWLAQAREQLAIQTQKRFQAAVPVHAKSFSEVMELIRSQLSLNLASLLQSVPMDGLLSRGLSRKQ